MQRILVTGGAGFIGSHVCKQLRKSGYHVVIIDNLSTGLKSATLGADLVVGDLNSQQDLENLFSKYTFDAVMHFAGSIEVAESVINPEKYYHNNVVSSLNLLNAMKKHNVKKLIFSSTAAVYGTPEHSPIDESHSLKPINPYGRSKLFVEGIIKDYAAAYNMSYVILRYFNAAGADLEGDLGENHQPETHLIPIIAQAALGKREALTIFGQDYETPDGTCVRDYIHINDLTTAHLKALKYILDGNASQIFNLGSEKGFSVKEILNRAIDILKNEYNGAYKLTVQYGEKRQGDPKILIASSQKAQSYLGWTCTLGIQQMLQTAINWELKKS